MQIFIFFGHDYLYPSEKRSELSMILGNRALELMKKSALSVLALCLASVAYAIYPFYLYLAEGSHPMPIPIILPFTDPETNTGYYLSLANQGFIMCLGIIGNFAIEIATTLTTNGMWAASDIINYRLNELGIGATRGEAESVRKAKLRNILIQIQDLER